MAALSPTTRRGKAGSPGTTRRRLAAVATASTLTLAVLAGAALPTGWDPVRALHDACQLLDPDTIRQLIGTTTAATTRQVSTPVTLPERESEGTTCLLSPRHAESPRSGGRISIATIVYHSAYLGWGPTAVELADRAHLRQQNRMLEAHHIPCLYTLDDEATAACGIQTTAPAGLQLSIRWMNTHTTLILATNQPPVHDPAGLAARVVTDLATTLNHPTNARTAPSTRCPHIGLTPSPDL